MLTVSVNRRRFLTFGGLALSSLLTHRVSGKETSSLVRGKSVIFLFQQGGPSQFETFDPKPDAPEGIRTLTGIVPTKVSGVQFGETLPKLAQLADKLTVYRSFQTNNAAHNIVPIVSEDSLNATLGALYSRVVGAVQPGTGMPTNTVLFPQSVDSTVTKGAARGNISATGGLGAIYAPFVPGVGGPAQQNMQLRLPKGQFEDRKELLEAFDRLRLHHDSESDYLDDLQNQAYEVLLSNRVSEALDLSKEDPKVLKNYDTIDYSKGDWSKSRRGQRGYYNGTARAIGKQLLLARRLCEAGCGFVTLHCGYEGVWDMHADGENLNVKDGMKAVGPAFDHAVAAFIADLEARKLTDQILLICCGEMGRTPRINKNGGRDHWARLSPLMMYGGGIAPGIIGRSTSDGGEPSTQNFTPKHLVSTILHTLFDVGRLRVTPGLGDLPKLAEHPPLGG
jgi:hypothetical protein